MPVVIDVSDLQSADTAAVRAVKELVEGGAVLQGASPYIAQLLVVDSRVQKDNNDG